LDRLIRRWNRRWRTVQSAIWIPRGIIAGAIIAILIAIFARTRPVLLPIQLIAITVALFASGGLIGLAGVWLWPRSRLQSARFFDRIFGLRERVSTAIELGGANLDQIADLQLADTLDRAKEVQPRLHLPIRLKQRDWIVLLALFIFTLLLIALPNPQSVVIAQQAAVTTAIKDEIKQLEALKQDIQKKSDLTPEQKAELSKIIDDTIKRLEQQNITKPEAVAALADAQQKFLQNQTQLSANQLKDLAAAGQALGQNAASMQAGQALQNGNLTQAAQSLQNLSNQLNRLDDKQSKDLADALDKSADSLDKVNPDAAKALRDAADALRKGDKAAAQKALQQASDALRNQQNQMNQSAMSQAAQNAARAAAQSQNDIAQAGGGTNPNQPPINSSGDPNALAQNNPQSGQPQLIQKPQAGQQNPQANPQTNPNGNGNTQPQPGNQNGPNGNQGQPQTGQSNGNPQSGNQNGDQGNPGQPNGGNQGGNQPPGNGNQPGQGGNQPPGMGQGQGQNDKIDGGVPPGAGTGGNQPGQGTGQNPGNDTTGPNARGAGTGNGGAGNDVTAGNPNPNGNPIKTDNNPSGDPSLTQSDRVYAPSFIGGNGGSNINPTGAGGDPGALTNQSTFIDPTTGNATVPLGDVVAAAAAQAASAMDADYVPIGLRGVIHDYFSGLQPAK
jgi:hypothetical protein